MNKFISGIVFSVMIGASSLAVAGGGGSSAEGTGVGMGLGVGLGVGIGEAEATAGAASEAAAVAAQEQTLRNNIDIAGDTTTVKNGSESSSSAVNAGNTMIIGGTVYGGLDTEGQAYTDTQNGASGSSTLSPVATATNGDQVNTQSNAQTVGDTNVTVVNEGLTDEQARALGQPDVVNIDSRSEEVDNSQIDASTTINNNNNYKQAVATAAPVFSSVCTSGASTQTRSLGIGLAVTSSVCEHLMMADAFNAMGNVEMVNQHLTKASKLANFRGGLSKFRSLVTLGIL